MGEVLQSDSEPHATLNKIIVTLERLLNRLRNETESGAASQ